MKSDDDDDGFEIPRGAQTKAGAQPAGERYGRKPPESQETPNEIDVEWTPKEADTKPSPEEDRQEPRPDPSSERKTDAAPFPEEKPPDAEAPTSAASPAPAPPSPPAPSADVPAAPRRAAPTGGWWNETALGFASRRPGRLAVAVAAVAALCGWLTSRLVDRVETALEGRFAEPVTALAWSDAGELYVGGAKGSAAVFDADGRLLRKVGPPDSSAPLGAVAAILPAPAADAAKRKAVFLYLRPEADPLGFVRWLDTPTASDPKGAPLTLPPFAAPERLAAIFDDGVVVAGERQENFVGSPVTGLFAAAGARPANSQQSPRSAGGLVQLEKGDAGIALLAPVPRANMLLAASEDGNLYEVALVKALGPGGTGGLTLTPDLTLVSRVTALGVLAPPGQGVSPLLYGVVGEMNGRLTFLSRSAPTGYRAVTAQLPGASAASPPRVEDIRVAADGQTALVRAHNGALFAVFLQGAAELQARPPVRLKTPAAYLALLTPDGARVVVADASGILRVYSLSREDGAVAEIAQIHGHGDVVHLMAISPDGRRVASASLDGRLRLTDLDYATRFFHWPLFATLAAPPREPMPAYTPPGVPQSQKGL